MVCEDFCGIALEHDKMGTACGRKTREFPGGLRVALTVGCRQQIGRKSSVYPGVGSRRATSVKVQRRGRTSSLGTGNGKDEAEVFKRKQFRVRLRLGLSCG